MTTMAFIWPTPPTRSWSETLVYMNYDGRLGRTTPSQVLHILVRLASPLTQTIVHTSPTPSTAPTNAVMDSAFASYTGTSWSHSTLTREAIGDVNLRSSLMRAITSTSHTKTEAPQKLKIATDKSGSWDSYLVDTGSSPSQLYPEYMTSMAMDDSGLFHIAHFDEKDDDLRYSTGTPTTGWNTEILDSSGHTGRDPSIAVDAANQPHIVYHTWSGQNLKYATFDPGISDWKISIYRQQRRCW